MEVYEKTGGKQLSFSVAMTEGVQIEVSDERSDAARLESTTGGAQRCKAELAPNQLTKNFLVTCDGVVGRDENATFMLTTRFSDARKRGLSESRLLEPAKAKSCGSGCQLYGPPGD